MNEHCDECGMELPVDVYDAQTALYGYNSSGFQGRDLARRIAESLERKAPWNDEEIAADAVREWLGIYHFASLTTAVRHQMSECEAEQDRRDREEATT